VIRVLIADDQALVRAGFRMILDAEEDLDVVGEAADGNEAVKQAARLSPDVVLMDIRMPELDGIEATRRVIDAGGDSPSRVLMLTTFDLNEYVYEALRAGASGFLLKDVPPEQLAAGIRVVAQGEALLAPSITKRLIQEFASGAAAPVQPPKGMDELTARELEVFKLVARGLSNAEIAAELIVSETTVKTHVARVC
jgi:DNA-binding NarL/FixJ family response regulator